MAFNAEEIKSKLVVKAVRNVRKGTAKDDASRGMYRPEVKMDLSRSRLITESYKMTDGMPMIMRRAKAMEHILNNMPIYILDWERIVGNQAESPDSLYFGIDMNWRSVQRVVSGDEGKTLLDDEGRAEMAGFIEYWRGKSMSDRQQSAFTGDILKYWHYDGTMLWSHWSEQGVPDYEKILQGGLKGIIAEAEEKLAELDRTVPLEYVDKKEFLQSVIIVMKAAVNFARRYAVMARELAREAADENEKERLLEIARTCERVPENPARTLVEAIQSFYFIYLIRYLEYSTLGIGIRFDKVFGPYYEADLASGVIARKEALELLQLLWVKIHEIGLIYSPTLSGIYGGVASLQAITIGGVDECGRDVTNEMTYLVLETAETMRSLEPSIVLRYHDNTPDELLARSVDTLATGIGYPSIFNDKSLIPLLEKWGVEPERARDYCVSGCVYIEVPGANVTRRAAGGLALAKCLWWALHRGVDPQTGEQRGARTSDPNTWTSEEDALNAYFEQVRFFSSRFSKIENTCRELYRKYLPRPFYSGIMTEGIQKAQDCRKWTDPHQLESFVVIMGITNAADSITAIKKLVFDDKVVSMAGLLEALDKNWEGYEDLRQMAINAPKYGNDDDYADDIAVKVHHGTSSVLAEFSDQWGFPWKGDGSGVSGTYGLAFDCGATPDGRVLGQPFADATLSPIQGGDSNGPTAVLKSASKISTLQTYNHLLNQKFLPQYVQGDMKPIFVDYLRTWGDLEISHIQFNIVDRQTLIEAQEKPDDYSDLIVRVAGYSAYFVDLSKGLQDSIIDRTEQAF